MPQWLQIFEQLKDFIEQNPSIEINRQAIIIPDAERPDFYKLFNEIPRAYVNLEFASELEETYTLRSHFNSLRDTLVTDLQLDGIHTNPDIDRYLRDPIEVLARTLHDPLFDVLRGASTVEEFIDRSCGIVHRLISTRYGKIYSGWVALSLISLVQAEEVLEVPVPDQFEDPELTDGETVPGLLVQEKPETRRARDIRLNLSQYTPLIVPNVILKKSSPGYIGLRFGYHSVYRRVPELNKHGEWFRREDIHREYGDHNLWPDIGIYLSGESKWLKVLADYYFISRPDIIIDIYESDNLPLEAALERISRHTDILKPRLGGVIVCRNPLRTQVADVAVENESELQGVNEEAGGHSPSNGCTESDLEPLTASCDIPVLVVGYETDKFKPLLEMMQRSQLNCQ